MQIDRQRATAANDNFAFGVGQSVVHGLGLEGIVMAASVTTSGVRLYCLLEVGTDRIRTFGEGYLRAA